MKVVGIDPLTGYPIFESKEDLNELQVCEWLNGAYRQVKSLKENNAELLDKVLHELKETFNNECPINYTSTQPFFTLENVRTLVDMVIKELKAEVENE